VPVKLVVCEAAASFTFPYVFILEVFVAWFIGQSLLTILLAFLLGLVVGWLWWGRRRSASTPEAAAAVGWQDETVPIMGIEEPTEPVVVADVPAARAPAEPKTPVVEPAAEDPAAQDPVLETPEPTAAEVFADEPEVTPTTDDNFQRIEGIGPKMNAALEAAGIRTYGQLAASDEQTLRDAINAAGLKFAPSLLTWAQQAQLLLNDDEEGLIDLQRRLVAGRDVGRV
jgi:predicted flap endonuclease-1-like 5' DNA nuclease